MVYHNRDENLIDEEVQCINKEVHKFNLIKIAETFKLASETLKNDDINVPKKVLKLIETIKSSLHQGNSGYNNNGDLTGWIIKRKLNLKLL